MVRCMSGTIQGYARGVVTSYPFDPGGAAWSPFPD